MWSIGLFVASTTYRNCSLIYSAALHKYFSFLVDVYVRVIGMEKSYCEEKIKFMRKEANRIYLLH